MNQWNSDHTKQLMRGSAAILGNFATQLQVKLGKEDFDITPDEALFLLAQINRFGESMTTLAKQHAANDH
jgi:hypothetical protein